MHEPLLSLNFLSGTCGGVLNSASDSVDPGDFSVKNNV